MPEFGTVVDVENKRFLLKDAKNDAAINCLVRDRQKANKDFWRI